MKLAIDHPEPLPETLHYIIIFVFVECATASLKSKLIATFVHSLHLFIVRLDF
jgi:hypothetical protein